MVSSPSHVHFKAAEHVEADQSPLLQQAAASIAACNRHPLWSPPTIWISILYSNVFHNVLFYVLRPSYVGSTLTDQIRVISKCFASEP